MKDKRSQSDKKSGEKKHNRSGEQSPRGKEESSGQQDNGNAEEGHGVTERFEVTITKMNTEDEDDGMYKISCAVLRPKHWIAFRMRGMLLSSVA